MLSLSTGPAFEEGISSLAGGEIEVALASPPLDSEESVSRKGLSNEVCKGGAGGRGAESLF